MVETATKPIDPASVTSHTEEPKPTTELAKKVWKLVQRDEEKILKFLKDICRIPSMDSQIGDVGERIAEEMRTLGFDEVRFDKMGNILGRIGDGPTKILYDSHIDTVGLGDPKSWDWDPFEGKEERGILFARGACDEKGSTPGMIYALAHMKELGILEGFTGYYFGNMEEWCDGIAPHALVEVEGVVPDYVIIGEPTKMQVYRGHRGRVELTCVTKGRSCHAAHPHLGDNAVTKMAKFVGEVEGWNEHIKSDDFLGKGTVVVSGIECHSPSINAVPDECKITIDRRLTAGETKESAIEELGKLPSADQVEIQEMWYDEPSYTGFVFKVDKHFPAWALDEKHALVQANVKAHEWIFGKPANTGAWGFSTNGIYWSGKNDIPCVGYAPSDEIYAHTTEDQVPLADVVRATAVYALIPQALKESGATKS